MKVTFDKPAVAPEPFATYVSACAICSELNDDDSTLEDGVYYGVRENPKGEGFFVLAYHIDDGCLGVI